MTFLKMLCLEIYSLKVKPKNAHTQVKNILLLRDICKEKLNLKKH